MPSTAPAVSIGFKVRLGQFDLGTFSSCDGLNVEVTVEQYEEGGTNDFVHQLPNRLKYTNLKLTRVLNADSQKVASFFAGFGGRLNRSTATVTAVDQFGDKICSWTFRQVFPVKWSGPQFTA